MKLLHAAAVAVATTGAFAATAAALPPDFGAWSTATRVESQAGTHESFNGKGLDGCPFIARDNRTLYMASIREGGLGGIDIWVARRNSPNEPWGAPTNLGAPVNSAANDFCPTMDRDGKTLWFVSTRPFGCGGADIYVARQRPGGWEKPFNLGCQLNSSADEASPSPLPQRRKGKGKVLYFSSTRAGGFAQEPAGAAAGDSDLYVSTRRNGVYGPAELVPGVNTASQDGQPNVRRDGLEIFFFSNRPGSLNNSNDIYAASRRRTSDPWSTPVNLGSAVNSDSSETRPSVSWDGTTLYFGSDRPGGEGAADHYVTTRSRD